MEQALPSRRLLGHFSEVERAGSWQCRETTSPMRQRAAHAQYVRSCQRAERACALVPVTVAGSTAEVTRSHGL